MSRSYALWSGVAVLFAVVLLKNICSLWSVLVLFQGLDSRYIAWANKAVLFIGLIILAAIGIDGIKIRWKYTLIRVSGLAIALFIPSYDWPGEAWKANPKANLYSKLISQAKSDPKVVLLDSMKSDESARGAVRISLVYDGSDQIELPFSRRSDLWKNLAPLELYSVAQGTCPATVTRIVQHVFYVVADCTK